MLPEGCGCGQDHSKYFSTLTKTLSKESPQEETDADSEESWDAEREMSESLLELNAESEDLRLRERDVGTMV